MLKNNSEQDQSLFEKSLLQFADTNAIDRIASSYQSNNKQSSEQANQTVEFFAQARSKGF